MIVSATREPRYAAPPLVGRKPCVVAAIIACQLSRTSWLWHCSRPRWPPAVIGRPQAAPDTPLITLALGESPTTPTSRLAGQRPVRRRPEVGAVLTTSPDVDMVTFTGPLRRAGRSWRLRATPSLGVLELGGKSAAIVPDDADFNMAALFAAFSMVTTPVRLVR